MLRKRLLSKPAMMLLVLAGALTFWLSESEQNRRQPAPAISQAANYYMENFRLVETDNNGQVIRWLNGKRLAHFDDQTTRLQNPQFIFRQADRPEQTWQLSADQGQIFNNKQVDLQGQVLIQRADSLPGDRVSIQSNRLQLDLEQQLASTDEQVNVVQTGAQVTATGMLLELDAQRLQLLSDVRGQYVP